MWKTTGFVIINMMWQTQGFESNKKFFEKLVRGDALSHAYLFTGQEMIGKKTFALELVNMLDVRHRVSYNPDLMFIDGQQGVTIDQIRDLKKFISFKSYRGKYKCAIIDDCHMMGQEAANSILKILEEPPGNSLIILITASPKLLLSTIFSRCQEIKFPPHPKEELLKYLETLGLNKKQAEFWADFSNGRLGLAYRLKEADAFKDIKKNLQEFNKILKSNINNRLNFAEKIFKDESSLNPAELILYWIFYLRSDLSKKLKINRAAALKKMIEAGHILSKPQYNHRLAFENLLINL